MKCKGKTKGGGMIRGGGFERLCNICGRSFIAVNNCQKYCGAECQRLAHSKTAKELYQKKNKKNKCIVCGRPATTLLCELVECSKQYKNLYAKNWNRAKTNVRHSGRSYTNTPERLEEIKNKYKNGVTLEHIKAMFEGGINEQIQSI